MVEFGKRLSQECAAHGPDWERHCIDYGALKNLISKEKEKRKGRSISIDLGGAPPSATELVSLGAHQGDVVQGSSSPSLQFRYALDREIEKAVLFVLQEQGNIATDLDQLAIRRAKFVDKTCAYLRNNSGLSSSNRDSRVTSSTNELKQIHEGYAMAARSVLRFVAFVDLNVTAVRKILKKHDKVTKKKLSHTYLSTFTNEDVDSHLDQLYNDGGLSSLVVTLRRAFVELHHIELELMNANNKTMTPQRAAAGGFGNQRNHRRIHSLPISAILGGRGQHERQLTESGSFANGLMNKETITTQREPLLQMIQLSRDKLKQNTNYVDIVAAQALMFEDQDDDTSQEGPLSDMMTNSQRLSSMLNLLSTLLYMTNYYIVAPTCGQYAARVGSTEAMAGIVIGMTPNAALIATILYGWWSNHSYKSALLFAATCSVLGNIAYGLALSYDSIHLVMIGRFLNGFGSARSINRRFIADTFSKRDRTSASAAFVTAGALGMAFGPALAAILSQVSFSAESTLLTEETSPAWVMLFLWSLFLIVSFFFFEEPDRSHIFGKKTALELTAKNNVGVGENKYLLAEAHSSHSDIASNPDPPLYKNVPVMVTMWVYFILKLVLECLLSSSKLITTYYFGWDSRSCGLFLAFLGLLMFPANMVVARLSMRYEDRELIFYTLVAMLGSIMGFIAYHPSGYSVVQYMLFAICIFITTNALEGPNMGLLSKTIPRSWAKGIFNTGFLATEAGTAARSVGDVWITLATQSAGVSGMMNAIFLPMLGLVILSVWLARKNYDQMVEIDEDDKKD